MPTLRVLSGPSWLGAGDLVWKAAAVSRGPRPPPLWVSQQHRPSAAASPVPVALRRAFKSPLWPRVPCCVPTTVSSGDSQACLLPPAARGRSARGGPPALSALTPDLSHTQGLCPTPGEVVGGQTRRERLMVGPSREGQLMLRKPDLLDGFPGESCKGRMWGSGPQGV